MVLKIEFRTKYASPYFLDSVVARARSVFNEGMAFVVSPPKVFPQPSLTPVRGVFRPPMRGPSVPPTIPNPVAGAALLAIALWELYQGTQVHDAPPHAPIDRPPTGVSVEQWQRDLDEMGRLAAEIALLQQEIHLCELWGMGSVAQPLRDRLHALLAQSAQNHDLRAAATAGSDAHSPAVAMAGEVTVATISDEEIQRFVAAARSIFESVQNHLVLQINLERYYLEILSRYEDFVLPRLRHVEEALVSLSRSPDIDETVLQELYQRNHSLRVLMPMFINAGLLDTARRIVASDANALSTIIDKVSAKYLGKVRVVQSGLEGVRLAADVDLDTFRVLLSDFVRMAFRNPKHPQDVVQVSLNVVSGVIIMSSNTRHFDLDWEYPEFRRHADRLGLFLEINMDDQYGTTVVMIPPAGMLEVDPFLYILGCRGSIDEIRIAIGEMPPERRIAILKNEMHAIFDRADDLVFSVAVDLATDKPGSKAAVQELRRTAIRFEQIVLMLVEGLSPNMYEVRVAKSMAQQLMLKVKNPVLY